MQAILVETILVRLVASIPSCEEGCLQPRGRVEVPINLIETLGLKPAKDRFLFSFPGPLVVFS